MNKVPLSILIPTKNEENNIRACLDPIADWADEIVIVDSNSTDKTIEIAQSYNNVKILNFDYKGGWPKKRQWALDTYNFKNDWILLLDVDEILLNDVKNEISNVIKENEFDGYKIFLQVEFLNRALKYAHPGLYKLSLFKKGKGRYEKRLESQDKTMADMEIHEHVIVEGKVSSLKKPILHRNLNTMHRYIEKHNEYSSWEANVLSKGIDNEIKPNLFGNQAQRRRWLKRKMSNNFLAPVLYFVYMYILKLGFLDGKPGFYYIMFKAIQMYHVNVKRYELNSKLKTLHS